MIECVDVLRVPTFLPTYLSMTEKELYVREGEKTERKVYVEESCKRWKKEVNVTPRLTV